MPVLTADAVTAKSKSRHPKASLLDEMQAHTDATSEEQMATCDNCGVEWCADELYSIDGSSYCLDCTGRCCGCNQRFLDDDLLMGDDEESRFSSCHDDYESENVIGSCHGCGTKLKDRDDTYYISGDLHCEGCWEDAECFTCWSCGENFYLTERFTDDEDGERCERCDGRYGVYHDDDDDDEEEEWSERAYSQCKAASSKFSVAGHKSDKIFTIDAEQGVVTQDGRAYIESAIKRHYYNLSYRGLFPDDFDWRASTEEGSLAKRISKYLHKTFEVRIGDNKELMSAIGNYATQYQDTRSKWYIDFTRDLGWRAGNYGDGSSCFFGGREQARCIIKTYGGFAMRTYTERNEWGVYGLTRDLPDGKMVYSYGRCWVFPIKRSEARSCGWEPCRTIREAQGYLVFNGYGDETVAHANNLARITKLGYARVTFSNKGTSSGLLYANGSVAYLVAKEQYLEPCRKPCGFTVDFALDVQCECGKR